MSRYLVTWEIDGGDDATTPLEAAKYAREAQLDVSTMAVVFGVTDLETGETTIIDLIEDDE